VLELRSIDGSCAKHLTVESYTVVMLLTIILIIGSKSFISGLSLPFLQILPTAAFFFFFGTEYCLLLLLSISVFLFSFSVLRFLVVGSVR